MQLWKLGCRWGSNTPLFYDFIVGKNIVIGWIDKDYQIGDWLLITDGHTVLSFAEILGVRKSVMNFPELQQAFNELEIPYDDKIFIYDVKYLHLNKEDQFSYPLQQGIIKVQGRDYIQKFNTLKNKYMATKNMDIIIDLLRYKKQIILQGPPGTGKTKMAKEIANALVNATNNISPDESNKAVAQNDVVVPVNDQIKKIQFHPSYSYEDFVRGIVAKPNPDGEGIFYEAENKTLGEFAQKALDNYIQTSDNKKDVELKSNLDGFISYVIEKLGEEEKFQLTENVYIFYADDKRFKYKGDNWTAHSNGLNMNFSELKKIINSGKYSRIEINKNEELNALTRQHATYFTKAIDSYNQFIKQNPKTPSIKEPRKDFVLIIDEINRANLSSVLGELIYALEYRGEHVESIYKLDDGSNEIVLPPNLYIIGTMNTADRSVGHIDYAIRRRFAFVDVLPEVLPDHFETALFKKVSTLFVKDILAEKLEPSQHLSSEFRPQDVCIGHSYFIKKENVDSKIRLKYEILPILEEYIKDGVLKESKELREILDKLESEIS